jgi:hypothetical protein
VGGETDVLVEHVGETLARHHSALCIQEQFRDADVASDRQPRQQIVGRLFPERGGALSTPFAQHPDRRGGVERDGGERYGEEFRHPQSSRKAQVEHGVIAYPPARPEIRDLQNSVHLGHGEVLDERHIGFFRRNGEDPTALLQDGRHTILDEAHEHGTPPPAGSRDAGPRRA